MSKKQKTILIGINLSSYGSTGTMMRNTLEYASTNGNFDYLIITRDTYNDEKHFNYMQKKYSFLSICINRLLKLHKNMPDGFFYYEYTNRIIKKIKDGKKNYERVFVYLNNIHSCYIDIRLLFNYLSKNKDIKIFYTLHDCWSFTGGCYCYSFIDCNNWKNECKNGCIQNLDKRYLPVDRCFSVKKKYTLKIKEQTTIIPVSNWLYNEVKQSFLKDFKTIVNHGECDFSETIDIDVSLIKQLNLENKKILVTVSAYWNDWKGYKFLYEIADKLSENYVLLVIGGVFDTKKYKNIIHINDVENKNLKKYYSIADVYISTSQNEALGLTTCEAQICGAPVVCFGHTAIKETITNKSGFAIGENDIEKFVAKIRFIVDNKPFKKEDIIKSGMRFAKYEHAKRMLALFEEEIRNEK